MNPLFYSACKVGSAPVRAYSPLGHVCQRQGTQALSTEGAISVIWVTPGVERCAYKTYLTSTLSTGERRSGPLRH